MQVPEDAEFLDETDYGELHWTEADFTYLAKAWVIASVQTTGRTKVFTSYQKGIVAQEQLRNNSGKTEKDQENDAHKIYQGLNSGNDFKHREAYTILV
ncbi:hypothetical protein GIB67_033907 [Kingdonia uniflora]|uniref:Uncharacterized protein n=1 Tax=Kingdonia uniflora TaxID=39325 RepID=A0A7J7NBR7_9MAGN|nr:hypothetical protein GIB67_033907 [Kingdonia uniflora]